MRLKGRQARLWQAEDLPLWTGTAPTVRASEFSTEQPAGAEQSREQTTWAECPICLDTLVLLGGPCPCVCFREDRLAVEQGATEHLADRVYDRGRDS